MILSYGWLCSSGIPNRYHSFWAPPRNLQKKLMGTSTMVLVQAAFNSRIRCVPSAGASGLILMTRSAAIPWPRRDGNNILAVVRSTDVRHQGHVVPNVKTLIAMQISLLEKANIAPAEIEYVAIYFHKNRIKIYLLLVSLKLVAPVSI